MATSKTTQTDTHHPAINFFKEHRKQTIVFVIAMGILFIRRPDILTHAQFWAEDGSVWYQQAIDHHFSPLTLFIPYSGYLVLLPRAVAILSGLVGPLHAPLLFNSIGIVVEIIPLLYLWSGRFATFIKSNYLKIFISTAYLLLPYTSEVHGNITSSQWYLAIIGFMILFIPPAVKKWQRFLEKAGLLLICLSGPFAILLLATIATDRLFFKQKKLITNDKLLIVIFGSMVQVVIVLFAAFNLQEHRTIGFSATSLFTIIGGQVFGAGILGEQSFTSFLVKPWVAPVLAILGLEYMIYVWLRAPRLLKAFILYAFLILTAALIHPDKLVPGSTWWEMLSLPQKQGGRYYFLPHLALYIALGWTIICQNNKVLKVAAIGVVAVAIITGVRADFRYKPVANLSYGQAIKHYETLPPGETMFIFINPGPPWHLTLKQGTN